MNQEYLIELIAPLQLKRLIWLLGHSYVSLYLMLKCSGAIALELLSFVVIDQIHKIKEQQKITQFSSEVTI